MDNNPDPQEVPLDERFRQLRLINMILDQLINLMSFEVRAPLSIILGYSSLILDHREFGGLNEELEESIQKIRKSSQRLFDIL
jgi:signal transduction histidine kinase